MENNPVAPTDAQPSASVASTTNSNETAPAGQAPAAVTEPSAEQIAKYLGTTPEGLEKFKKFSDNNGGFDKVFGERKKEITTPQPQQSTMQQPSTEPSATQAAPVTQQATTNNLNMEYIEGAIVRDYFKELASNPDYTNIASQLTDGTVMEEASKRFGIAPIKDGQINKEQIKAFCDMYSKSMPAAPASAPMTNTPIASSVPAEFTGPINSTNNALAVIQENNQRLATGMEAHPKLEEAKKFLANGFKERNHARQEFVPWAQRKANKGN